VSKSKDEPAGSMLPLPLQFLAAWLAVWLGRVLQQEVDYLMAENRVLRERLGNKKLRRSWAWTSSRLNAFAERFVLSIQSECFERMVPLGEEYLRRAILEYMAHYHGERNHQGLGNALVNGAEEDLVRAGRVVRRDRIGGLLHFYHRRTASSARAE
jgi:hypothetical protein